MTPKVSTIVEILKGYSTSKVKRDNRKIYNSRNS